MAEFRQANQSLVLLAQRDLGEFWRSLNLSGDPARVKSSLLAYFPELVQVYGDAAALLGADWYDALRDVPASARSFKAVLASPVQREQAEASARWALGPLFLDEPDPVSTLSRVMGSAQRLVLQPGRNSFAESANRDPVRARWARVPSGSTTCKWCVMLASRGAVYVDDIAAGDMNHFHDNCDCVQVQVRSASDYPEGHSVEEFKRLHADYSGIGRDLPTD